VEEYQLCSTTCHVLELKKAKKKKKGNKSDLDLIWATKSKVISTLTNYNQNH